MAYRFGLLAAGFAVSVAGASSLGSTSCATTGDSEDAVLLQGHSSMRASPVQQQQQQEQQPVKPVCTQMAPRDSALIVIDMQYCFINGSLGVDNATDIIPTINGLAALPGWNFVGYTKDFHPHDHISFASAHPGKEPFSQVHMNYTETGLICGEQYAEKYGGAAQASCSPEEIKYSVEQTLWPDHCVQNTPGDGGIHHDVVLPESASVVRKGYTTVLDSYGAFYTSTGTDEGNLKDLLHDAGVKHLYIVGLVLDYCVKSTALQGAELGFDVAVALDATKYIAEDTAKATLESFKKAGVDAVQSTSVAETICE